VNKTKIQKIRLKKLLTQKELSKASRVSWAILKKYESGERDISKANGETLLKLSTALGCQIEDLIENKHNILTDVIRATELDTMSWIEMFMDDNVSHSFDIDSEDFEDCNLSVLEMLICEKYALEKNGSRWTVKNY
jgi:Helix-turn-helix.